VTIGLELAPGSWAGNNGSDKVAISNYRSRFNDRANNIICWFSVLDKESVAENVLLQFV